MNKFYTLFSYIFISLLMVGCKSRVYLTVTEPPAVHINEAYKNGAIVNRSHAEGASKVLETIDNGISLEGNLDVKGSNAAVQGAYDYLTSIQRFNFLTILDSMTVKNGGIDVFPAPLPWNEVEDICSASNVDFLIALEVYDTDTKINYSTGMTTKQTPLGNVKVPVHNARMVTLIKTGWRIYDPLNKLILDEFFINDQLVSSGSGINPVAAAATLLNRGQAVTQISTQVGQFYAGRVEFQRFRVWRNYYTKGNRVLKMANRRAEAGDWEGAAELWEKEMDSPKRKVAGRAHYNMAIYKEIIGDVDGALELAQKSYSDYRIKEGLNYASILRNRIARRQREEVLSNQN